MNEKENMQFKKFVEELHKLAIANKDKEVPDVVSNRDALIAYYIVSHIDIIDEGDALLFLIANNLINTYIKQPEALTCFKYVFKNSLFIILNNLKKRDFPNIKVNYIAKELNNNNLILFTIYDMQFSYHSIPKRMEWCITDKYKSDTVFAGVRNKNCINELFARVLKNKIKYNNITIRKKPLLKNAYDLADDYLSGKLKNKDIKYICRLPDYCYTEHQDQLGIKVNQINQSSRKSGISYILQSKWGEFYRSALDKLDLEESKGKLCTISATLKQNEADLNAAIDIIKKNNYVPVDKITPSSFIIVKDEEDKDRLISKLKHPYNGEFIKLK
ncbi:MAG: hypothetical protein MJ214_01125 [Bacilli bacterium]|nr:hypothetical protein [Bacilli bacterium]